MKKNSKQLRLEYLTDKAMALSEEDGKPYQGYLKQMIKGEEMRSSFRNIKSAQGKYDDLNITMVEQGPDDRPRQRIYEKNEMEEAIKSSEKARLLLLKGGFL